MTLELYKEIRAYLKEVIKGTQFENKTYCVGGCCRDEILGNDIKDIDIVVELPNGGIDLASWLYSQHYTFGNVQVFSRFGTAMFKLNKYPDIEIEVVHTRCEKYPDGTSRNPVTDYGTIQEDCYRRDLTINCLYYNISQGQFCDFCGYSIDHIKNHIICTPYNPDVTYSDDPLRILRCVRFATRYGWEIENQTYQALKRNIDRLYIISQERITDEFMKIISDRNYFHGLNILNDIGAFKYILTPYEINSPNTHYPQLYEYLPNLMVSPLLDNIYTRLVVLLYPYAQYAEQILRHRKLPSIDVRNVCILINLAEKYLSIFKYYKNSDYHIRECQYKCITEKRFKDLIKVLITLDPTLKDLMNINYNKCNHFAYILPVDGEDIMNILNIGPSETIKNIIDMLLGESFRNPNITKEECIEFIKKLKVEN